MNRTLHIGLLVAASLIVAATLYIFGRSTPAQPTPTNDDPAARFAYLSAHGNSSCPLSFQRSISTMPADGRLQGSCCSPMVYRKYIEQVRGLRAYAHIAEIPPDPYDVSVGLARRLMAYNGVRLSAVEQKAYSFAMTHSNEHGPCCCRCWRWTVYGGLGKLLIQKFRFTGAQVAAVWNLSDGCGGNGESSNKPMTM